MVRVTNYNSARDCVFICNRGRENIGLNRDSNPEPQECPSCTLSLSYRTTCRIASRYITKYVDPATYTHSKLEFGPYRERNIVKCSRGAEAVANHNQGYLRCVPNVTCGGKISGSTGIRTQGLRNTDPALCYRTAEPHICQVAMTS